MTNLKRLLYVLSFSAIALVPFLAFAPSVSAATPICIINSVDNPNDVKPCASVEVLPLLGAAGIDGALPDTCYYMDIPPPINGWPSSTPGTVNQAPLGSPQCNDWQQLSKTAAGAAPICFNVTGDNVNNGTYVTGHVTSDLLKKATCTPAMLNKQPTGSKLDKFNKGTCYLVFSNGTIVQDSCANILLKASAANQTDKNKVATDAKPIDDDPNGSTNSALSPSQQQAEIQRNCKPAGKVATQDELKNCIQQNPLIKDINLAINLLSGLVGVIVVIMMIVGGIQYMTAGGNPQAVAVAKKRISNAALSILALLFMYSFLQWLIPGGIF